MNIRRSRDDKVQGAKVSPRSAQGKPATVDSAKSQTLNSINDLFQHGELQDTIEEFIGGNAYEYVESVDRSAHYQMGHALNTVSNMLTEIIQTTQTIPPKAVLKPFIFYYGSCAVGYIIAGS